MPVSNSLTALLPRVAAKKRPGEAQVRNLPSPQVSEDLRDRVE